MSRSGFGENGRRRGVARRAMRRRRRHRERDGRTYRTRRISKRWLLGPTGLLLLMLGFLGTGAGVAFAIYQSIANDLVEPTEIELTQRSLGTSKVFDSHGIDGELLFEFTDPFAGLRNPIKLEDVSRHLINATVSTEDSTFFENRGINTRGLLRAAWENVGLGEGAFLGGSGGSSITQQLVKNVLIPLEERSQRSVDRKLKETILALELTEQYRKTEILEWYLNSIFYGNHAYGIGAASQRYFGKPAADLSLAESTLLAGLPQAPATHDPITNPAGAKSRQADILDLMVINGYLSQAESDLAKAEPLQFVSQQFEIKAPHFVLYVQNEILELCSHGRLALPDGVATCDDIFTDGGLRVTTTLDYGLQLQAEQIVRNDLATFEEQTGAHNAALISIDPRNGEIRVMVGSRDFFREDIDGQVNNAIALNSPGSSIKPITYVTGFLRDPQRWNPATIIWDVPFEFEEFDGTSFAPENFDGVFRGPVSVRSALANSMNVPAFRMADALGVANVLDVAHRLGITTMQDLSRFGPSLTLGGGDVTLLDMVFAYSVFANEGVMRGQHTMLDLPFGNRALDPVAIREIHDVNGKLLYRLDEPVVRRVLPAQQAFQITDILSDNQARSTLYGTNSTLVLDRPAAAKTGTAGEPGRNDVRRDFWTVGYTPQLVTGVWVGNADNEAMTGGSSSRTAGLIWHDLMVAAHRGLPIKSFAQPDGLTQSEVFVPSLRVLSGEMAREDFPSQSPCSTSVTELFVAGSVPDKANRICTELEIDTRTFRPATADTPDAARFEGFFHQPPIDVETSKPDEAIVAWLRTNKVRFVGNPGFDTATENAVFARLDTPPNGTELGRGNILVRGRAAGDGVVAWSLSYTFLEHPGDVPSIEDFVELARSENALQSGQLGRWDTRALEPGLYLLRLTVEHDFLGTFLDESFVLIAKEDESSSTDQSTSEDDAAATP